MAKAREQEFQELYDRAVQAGYAAGTRAVPNPMTVTQHANPLDDSSPVVYAEVVDEGMCGFAWVNIKPGTSSFARWLKKNKLARTDYYGGVSIWIHEHSQSYERKMIHAREMARVFNEAGIKATPLGRLD